MNAAYLESYNSGHVGNSNVKRFNDGVISTFPVDPIGVPVCSAALHPQGKVKKRRKKKYPRSLGLTLLNTSGNSPKSAFESINTHGILLFSQRSLLGYLNSTTSRCFLWVGLLLCTEMNFFMRGKRKSTTLGCASKCERHAVALQSP